MPKSLPGCFCGKGGLSHVCQHVSVFCLSTCVCFLFVNMCLLSVCQHVSVYCLSTCVCFLFVNMCLLSVCQHVSVVCLSACYCLNNKFLLVLVNLTPSLPTPANADFTPSTTTITFQPGDKEKEFVVGLEDDLDPEGPEYFQANVTHCDSSDATQVVIGNPNQPLVEISDRDSEHTHIHTHTHTHTTIDWTGLQI